MKIKFWDGYEKQAADHNDAVKIIVQELSSKKDSTQKIEFTHSSFFKSELPTIATVFTDTGMPTDLGAVIIRKS